MKSTLVILLLIAYVVKFDIICYKTGGLVN